jgi:conjugative transfer signal peptidase TraF
MSDCARRPDRRMTVGEIEGLLVRMALATACASALTCLVGSHLLWNWTPSLPLGLYWVSPRREANVGALVAFPVPASVRALVRERRYLPPGAVLVKPVVARASDDVCTEGGRLTVNGAPLGAIATADTRGRPLPHDARCGPLPAGVVFVASHLPTSFDSRTFGPVPISELRGTVTPLWTY